MPSPVITLMDVPAEYFTVVDARIAPVLEQHRLAPNLELLVRSCYLMGVQDGVQIATTDPTLFARVRELIERELADVNET